MFLTLNSSTLVSVSQTTRARRGLGGWTIAVKGGLPLEGDRGAFLCWGAGVMLSWGGSVILSSTAANILSWTTGIIQTLRRESARVRNCCTQPAFFALASNGRPSSARADRRHACWLATFAASALRLHRAAQHFHKIDDLRWLAVTRRHMVLQISVQAMAFARISVCVRTKPR